MGSVPSQDLDSVGETFVTRHMGWVGAALAFGLFWVQTLSYIGAVSACENVDSGSSRGDLCGLMSPWGHVWLLAGPPILVMIGGVWGQRTRQLRYLLACVLAAVVLGIVLPLVAFEATSPR